MRSLFRSFISYVLALSAALFVLSAAAAHAQVSLVLNPNTQLVEAGALTTFEGRILNESQSDSIFLNGITFNYDGSDGDYITADDSLFLEFAPPVLGPTLSGNDAYSGSLFSVFLNGVVPNGRYSGFVTILGGLTETQLLPLQSSQFTVLVGLGTGIAAPEPTSLRFLFGAMLFLPAFIFFLRATTLTRPTALLKINPSL